MENKSSTENKALSARVSHLLPCGAVPFCAWILIATKERFCVISTPLFSWGVLKNTSLGSARKLQRGWGGAVPEPSVPVVK